MIAAPGNPAECGEHHGEGLPFHLRGHRLLLVPPAHVLQLHLPTLQRSLPYQVMLCCHRWRGGSRSGLQGWLRLCVFSSGDEGMWEQSN